MLKIIGILKREEIKEFTKKDGTIIKVRTVYIEPKGSIYPVKVNISDMSLITGKEGETITLDIEAYPYYFENGQRKKAMINYYVPKTKR